MPAPARPFLHTKSWRRPKPNAEPRVETGKPSTVSNDAPYSSSASVVCDLRSSRKTSNAAPKDSAIDIAVTALSKLSYPSAAFPRGNFQSKKGPFIPAYPEGEDARALWRIVVTTAIQLHVFGHPSPGPSTGKKKFTPIAPITAFDIINEIMGFDPQHIDDMFGSMWANYDREISRLGGGQT